VRFVALGQIMAHIRKDRMIWLEELPAITQLLKAACGDPVRLATTERNMQDIAKINCEFSLYFAEFPFTATDLNWNSLAIQNAQRMGLSQDIKDFFQYYDMSEDVSTFLMGFQKSDNQILEWRAAQAAQNWGGVVGFASPSPPVAPKAHKTAPAGTVAACIQHAPMDLSAGKWRNSAKERVRRFADGRCLHSCNGTAALDVSKSG
jgi:hypothetical protein